MCQGQYRAHAPLQQRVVTLVRIGPAVAVAKGQGAFANTFKDDGIQIAVAEKFQRRLQPVRGKARTRSDAVNVLRIHGGSLARHFVLMSAPVFSLKMDFP